ncbi:GNAT family N-acetyltransferase [Mucilaginibacter conchicola]|uniref:GNAT family N-acetyltransferase n=1 Tax=Mucilaginibacter conchicola TaxID=2303333 RepID=A0A372NQT5_9SPHI|nr:GNAT family N-acetyltransferase [Mucilaginibacter conchicola]RFZ91282.1 GNAT family N-acetyltransferase [Mucilaginibacter conchicola]
MEIDIWKPSEQEYNGLIRLWEKSVRATHDFLYEKDINRYRSMLEAFLPIMNIHCAGYDHNLQGFIGITDQKIQALFIHPGALRMGLGKLLVHYAIRLYRINEVDVNEQNIQALNFYEYLGFRRVGRNQLDGAGKPYPILNMLLKQH